MTPWRLGKITQLGWMACNRKEKTVQVVSVCVPAPFLCSMNNKTLLLPSSSDPVPWSSASSELSIRLWFKTGDHKLEFHNRDSSHVIRHGGLCFQVSTEFLRKEISNYISNWLGPPTSSAHPTHTWNSEPPLGEACIFFATLTRIQAMTSCEDDGNVIAQVMGGRKTEKSVSWM